METKYIGVFWTNFYLSSIQHGIQCAHTVGMLTARDSESPDLDQWLHKDCTINLRNGGDNHAMLELKGFMEEYAHNYPWAYFEESKGALNGLLTCVGIVLPEYVFAPDFEPEFNDNSFEADMYRKIKNTSLAR